MFGVNRVVLNVKGRKYSFSRDKHGYFFTNPLDEKKYRGGRFNYCLPVGDKIKTIEEHEATDNLYRIGHIEMRNFSFNAQIATIYYMKEGKERRKIVKDESNIEMTIEDGCFFEEDI